MVRSQSNFFRKVSGSITIQHFITLSRDQHPRDRYCTSCAFLEAASVDCVRGRVVWSSFYPCPSWWLYKSFCRMWFFAQTKRDYVALWSKLWLHRKHRVKFDWEYHGLYETFHRMGCFGKAKRDYVAHSIQSCDCIWTLHKVGQRSTTSSVA